MAPPSKLGIATSAVQRLVKEETSYHKELEQQRARIANLESETSDENAEYQLKQERQALSETETVLASMKGKIASAVEQLELQLEENKDGSETTTTSDVTKAEQTVAEARKAIRDST